MSKVWEFAVSPKQAALMAGCLVVAGILLSGAGVATGLLLAPRLQALQARAAVPPPAVPLRVARKPAAPEPAVVASVVPLKNEPAVTPPAPIESVPAATVVPIPENSAPPAAPPIRLAVQLGTFSLENAGDMVERLKMLGYPAAAYPRSDSPARGNVVQIGPYGAYDSASRIVLELSGKYRLDPVIIPLTHL